MGDKLASSSSAAGTSSGNIQSIQVLLEAEKEASRIVEKARQYRVQRLRDARSEAETEIEALKASKQHEYAEYEKNVVGSLDLAVSEYTEQTRAQLDQVCRDGEAKSDEIVKMFVDKVLDVQPKLHRNVQFGLNQVE